MIKNVTIGLRLNDVNCSQPELEAQLARLQKLVKAEFPNAKFLPNVEVECTNAADIAVQDVAPREIARDAAMSGGIDHLMKVERKNGSVEYFGLQKTGESHAVDAEGRRVTTHHCDNIPISQQQYEAAQPELYGTNPTREVAR